MKAQVLPVNELEETDSTPPPPIGKLRRTKSVIEHAQAAADHVTEHKHKYSTCCVLSTVGIIVGCVLGLAAAAYYRYYKPALEAQLSASKGTTLKPVSPLPAKGDSSRRRLFSALNLLRKSVGKYSLRTRSPHIVDPSEFDELSDYNLMLDPTYVVDDASASAVNQINMISCYIDQLKVKDLLPFQAPYIAMVDTKLCGQEDGVQSWSVTPRGPAGMGDGVYSTDLIFVMGGGGGGSATKAAQQSLAGLSHARRRNIRSKNKIHHDAGSSTYTQGDGPGKAGIIVRGLMKNTVTDSQLIKSEIFLDVGDRFMKIALVVDYPVVNVTEGSDVSVKYIQKNMYAGDPDYLNAIYDPSTSVGAASSRTTLDNSASYSYSLAFTDSAIKRKTIDQGSTAEICLDFSVESRKLVGDRYTLFDAGDGTKVTFEPGFIIQRTVENYPNPIQAYVSNWGVWGFWFPDENGNWIDGTPFIVEDGVTVEKVNYDGPNTLYTLSIVPARMTKITNHHVTLDELKGLPLVVQSSTTWMDERVIAWNGSTFQTLSTFSSRCVYYDRNNYWMSSPIEVNDDVVIDNYMDCGCLDSDGSARSSGDYLPCYNPDDDTFSNDYMTANYVSLQTIEKSLENPTSFYPSVANYPNGLYVRTRTNMLNARIEFKFDQVQTMYGVKTQKYVSGTRVRQASSGAEGIVYSSTKVRLTGFACDNCISYTYKQMSKYAYDYDLQKMTCSAPDSPFGFDGGYLMKGLKLTQGSAVGYATDDWSWVGWNGFGIDVVTGTFDLTNPIEVSMPSTLTGSLLWYDDISGTISPPTLSSLSWSWEDITVTEAVCEGSVSFDVSVVGVSDAEIFVYHSDWYGTYAYVSQVGSICTNPVVSVSVAEGNCTKLPQVKVRCTAQIRDDSSSVVVSVTSANKFVGLWYGGGPIIYGPDGGTENIGTPYWINDAIGNMKPINGNTTLTYTTYTTVNAGDDVPELLCYDNCPDANPKTWPTCSGSTCKEDRKPSHLNNRIDLNSGGSCTGARQNLPTVSFRNIKGNPHVNLTWDSSYDDENNEIWFVSFISLLDPGYDCQTSGQTPEIVFSDDQNACKSLPSATVTCQTGNDISDYRQAFRYNFNSRTGKLSDIDGNATVISDNPNYQSPWSNEFFGPFFENTPLAKSQLLCDYDNSEVCSWKAWSTLDEIYYYNTGPGSVRASLVKNGEAVNFGSPINLLYTHSGTASNSGHDYDGVTTMLSYGGPGDLRGLPQFCLDPETQEKSNICVPTGSVDATMNMDDIVIPTDNILYDLDGNAFYAKAQIMKEFYPIASDATICNGLNFNSAPGPVDDDIIEDPLNIDEEFPSVEVLEGKYLSGGKPVVVRGIITPNYVL